MKIIWNNITSVKHVVFKFIQELKFQIISIIYAGNLTIINIVITTVKYIEKGLEIANESKQVYVLKN